MPGPVSQSLRAGVLGGLALLTIGLPFTQVFAELSLQTEAAVAASETLDLSVRPVNALPEAGEIRREPGAAARAAVRQQLTEADYCLQEDTAANGARTALSGADAKQREESLLVWPVAKGQFQVASAYGGRIHPIFGARAFHYGEDLSGASGTKIYSATGGVVRRVGWESGVGYSIEIFHPHLGISTLYGHLISNSGKVAVGQQVTAGQVIALMGSTGNSTGVHLHFEVHHGDVVNNETATSPTVFMSNHGARYLDGDGRLIGCD